MMPLFRSRLGCRAGLVLTAAVLSMALAGCSAPSVRRADTLATQEPVPIILPLDQLLVAANAAGQAPPDTDALLARAAGLQDRANSIPPSP
jgi:hypothetical protein